MKHQDNVDHCAGTIKQIIHERIQQNYTLLSCDKGDGKS